MHVVNRLNAIHILLLAFSVLLTLCAWLAGGPTEILGVLPAVLLAVCLAFNRYPGEELIARLVQRFRPPRAKAASDILPSPVAVAIRPSLLLLASVRQLRGPPLALTRST